MLGNSFFGFSGGGGGTPPPTNDSWLLDGNTNGAEKYFGTNDNYSIPIYTNGIARGVFTSDGNFGFGITSSVSARLYIKGVDSTSSNYALKIDNSSSSSLFYVRNDGNIKILTSGSGTPSIEINTSSAQDSKIYFSTNNSATIRGRIYLEDSTQTFNFYTLNNDTIFWNGNGLAQTKTLTLFTDTSAKFESNVGIGVAAIGKLHVLGVGSTSVNQRLEPVSGVTEDTTGNTVNTTDATANVTAQTIATTSGSVISLESTIVYRKTGGVGVGSVGDGTTIKLNSSVKNVGGTLTLDTVQNTYTGTTNAIAGVSATYTISGTNVLVSVTGVVNDNITWNVITKVNKVA